MARKPTDTQNDEHIVTDADTPGLPAVVEAANQIAAADAVIIDALEVIKAVGRIEMAQFSATVAEKAIIETFLKIKESKRYKGLPYRKPDGSTATVADLEEFCQAYLGKSARRVQEMVANYHLVGADLYEQAERIGLRQRDYNAIKALPADDQEIIKQALAEDSKDRVLEVLQDMAIKHAKEKEALAKQAHEAEESYRALDKVLADEKAANQRLSTENAKLQGKAAAMTPEMKQKAALDNLHRETLQICAHIDASLRSKITALFAGYGPVPPEHARMAASQALGQIIGMAHDLAGDFTLRALSPAEATAVRPNDAMWTAAESHAEADE